MSLLRLSVQNKIQLSVDKKKSIEMFSNISLCTLDIILQCAMSYKDDFQLKGIHPYVKAVAELTELWEDRIRNPWLRSDAIYFLTSEGRKFKRCCDFAHSIADDVIRARQESLARDGPPEKRYLDFLDVLLMARDENGNGLTAKEIRDEVDTFMFEGHDTTASAITWTLYSLAKHPGYQRKVQAELDLLMEGRESQDITCPVPSVGRQLTEPLTLEGITFPQGTFCFLNLISIHHNPTVWEDPLTFRPERFLPENMKDKDSHAVHWLFSRTKVNSST
ncbi:hypothetical protein C0Q70_11887 [Pomacea canaliculata]|uniref:Uncharacterized protein n=1 Tax=Pomacea canaliculata TaxID=400727 RepID=A0A2T7P790_POMCA|nr:hypothetical protein C0Q70_11887 [Pomacea canaliculata]